MIIYSSSSTSFKTNKVEGVLSCTVNTIKQTTCITDPLFVETKETIKMLWINAFLIISITVIDIPSHLKKKQTKKNQWMNESLTINQVFQVSSTDRADCYTFLNHPKKNKTRFCIFQTHMCCLQNITSMHTNTGECQFFIFIYLDFLSYTNLLWTEHRSTQSVVVIMHENPWTG